jgi:hypothetical protein
MQINMVKEYSGNRGFVASVADNSHTDYLAQAYLQALSIKTTQHSERNYAVIVNQETANRIEPKHEKIFDRIIVNPDTWSFSQEWRVRNLSPWKRSIKVDADMLFVNDIGHWWNSFEKWRVLFTSVVENYKSNVITSRWHRALFDLNHLPDIYTAFYYFRDGPESAEFFELCAEISDNWDWFANEFLIKNDNPTPRDDEIFSIAAEIYGVEKCTLPGAAYPRFVHLKEPLNTLPAGKPWHDQLHVEHNSDLWIGHYPQRLPIHYTSKTFATNELIEHYEQNYRKLMGST